MRKTRKSSSCPLQQLVMAEHVSAAVVMADEIKDLYDYELQTREMKFENQHFKNF